MNKIHEDQVFEYYQDGLPDDFKIDKSKIVRKKVDMDNSTVQISIKFDFKLLEKVRNEAEKKSIPYQTFIKDIIRDYFDEESFKKELKSIKKSLNKIEKKLESKII